MTPSRSSPHAPPSVPLPPHPFLCRRCSPPCPALAWPGLAVSAGVSACSISKSHQLGPRSPVLLAKNPAQSPSERGSQGASPRGKCLSVPMFGSLERLDLRRTTNLAVDSSLLFSATCMRIDFSAGFASVCRHACYKDCSLSASSPSWPTIGERSSNKPLGRVTPPQDQDQDHRQASCPVRP